MGLLLAVQAPLGAATAQPVYAYTERAATVNASSLNVRSGPGTTYSSVAKLSSGTAVTVTGETTGADGKLWYQIRFAGSGTANTGYVLGTYVKFPVAYTHDGNFESQLAAQGFPESYKDGLRQLHAQYPNWVFQAQNTGLDWNTVIQNEGVLGRNLVATGSISSYKSLVDGAYNWDNGTWTGFDGSAWVAASEDILRYYMDPRNFFDEVNIFQFLSHRYDPSVHTKEGLEQLVKGTFLENGIITRGSGSGTGTGTGGTPGGGPGGGSGQSSSGVIVSPGAGGSYNGIGSSGPGGQSSGSSGVVLQAPQASISRKDAPLVATAVLGVKPGEDAGGASSQGTSGGSSSQVVAGGSSSQPPAASGTPSSNSPSAGAPGSSGSPSTGTPAGSGSPTVGTSPAAGGTQDPGAAGTTYVDIIMQAASQTGVNPYVLAAMIIQEQGSDARGRSISGTVSGYEGYYNYFNVGAYAANGMGAVERGLWYASQNDIYGRPWNTPEKSILGGAQFYGSNYVDAGQDTFYLKKYNVQGSNLYKHQYMTNVDGAAAEACLFAEGYSRELKNSRLVFKIPVYANMPASPCAKPTTDGSPNNKLRSLGADGFSLTPTFSRDTTSYDLIVDHSVGSVNIYAQAIDANASVSGTGAIQLQSGNNSIRVQVRAQNGSVREYVINVVRQTGGPTYNASIGGGTSPASGGSPTPGGSGVIVGGSGSGTGSSSPVAGGSGTGSSSPVVGSGGLGNGQPAGSGTGTSGAPSMSSPGGDSAPAAGGSGSGGSAAGGGSAPTPGGSNVTIVY